MDLAIIRLRLRKVANYNILKLPKINLYINEKKKN